MVQLSPGCSRDRDDFRPSRPRSRGAALRRKRGAGGDVGGLLAPRAALFAGGKTRRQILVPESAHGTNPASAATAGFSVVEVEATDDGRVHLAALKEKLSANVAGI